MDPLEEVEFDGPEKFTYVSSLLFIEEMEQLPLKLLRNIDVFPLSRIDQIVDATTGHGILSFLDAIFGYHQILMHLPDLGKTTFITLHGLYCSYVMPFGLKNVGVTDESKNSVDF